MQNWIGTELDADWIVCRVVNTPGLIDLTSPSPPPPPPPLWVTSPSLKFPLLEKTVIIFNQHITFYNSNDAKECKKMSRSIPFQTNSFTVFFNIIT